MAGAPAHRLPCLHHGSSPHGRGTLAHLLPTADELRFIPTCVGNAWPGGPSWSSPPVHPRIRGERIKTAREAVGYARFIPAYAGNASIASQARRMSPVHPRIRGERWPRWRAVGRCPRFIPAYAGNAAGFRAMNRPLPVHPRIRGERFSMLCRPPMPSGSSPHTRGTLEEQFIIWRPIRFIPAYAGNACKPGTGIMPEPVHPRIRGERSRANVSRFSGIGSSPHTRGTRADISAASCIDAVHPRIRGERRSRPATAMSTAGSSPHTRGTHEPAQNA